MKTLSLLEQNLLEQPVKDRCVVRLSTSYYRSGKGFACKKQVTPLRRKCIGYNILEEDSSLDGVEEVLPKVKNLLDAPDGVYEVTVINAWRDWESGYVEDYDYLLVPFIEDNENNS